MSDWLGVTVAWVYAETRADRIPHIKVGRYYRYLASSIEAWLREQEHG
jgi:predicted DNA-binding transcriptional regulator AlpA